MVTAAMRRSSSPSGRRSTISPAKVVLGKTRLAASVHPKLAKERVVVTPSWYSSTPTGRCSAPVSINASASLTTRSSVPTPPASTAAKSARLRILAFSDTQRTRDAQIGEVHRRQASSVEGAGGKPNDPTTGILRAACYQIHHPACNGPVQQVDPTIRGEGERRMCSHSVGNRADVGVWLAQKTAQRGMEGAIHRGVGTHRGVKAAVASCDRASWNLNIARPGEFRSLVPGSGTPRTPWN